MKRKLLPRALLCVLLVLYLALMPGVLARSLQNDFYSSIFQQKLPEWEGSVTLYHIVSARSYQGSVTYYLQTQAEAFMKKNRGIHIQVIGMDPLEYAERVANGRLPDALSFFAGQVAEDELSALSLPQPELRPGLRALRANPRAVPYFFSASVLVRGMEFAETELQAALQTGELEIDALSAARLRLSGALLPASSFAEGKAAQAYLDLGEYGRLLRSALIYEGSISCPDNFTATVCYAGVLRHTDAEKQAALEKFFAWLLEEQAQTALAPLGVFSVRADAKLVYALSALHEIDKSYATVQTVDPFLWNAHLSALITDAAPAVAGDSFAAARFEERLRLVLLP
ncbi:MAG: hypothetical protein FWF10_10985 [Clostridiales bacterium]|nr:hypothetical protein [Clostridiales bacterium]